MGLSSSQSRFLTLTARLSDLELKAQTIQHQKIRLAEESTEASKKYLDALNAETMVFNSPDQGKVDATVANITASEIFRIVDAKGYYYEMDEVSKKWILKHPNDKTQDREVQNESNMRDAAWLLEQLKLANLFVQKKDVETEQWLDYSYVSSSVFTTVEDNSEVAKAEAEYECTMAEVQGKDKKLDLDLDNINTEHTAVDTEMDSVQNVVDKNIESTFKIFS